WIRCVIDVADVEAGGAKDADVGDALGGRRVPERTALAIGLNKMDATGPERGVPGGLTLGPYKGVVLGVDPDPSFEQTLLVSLGDDIYGVCHSTVPQCRARHPEFVVLLTQARLHTQLGV